MDYKVIGDSLIAGHGKGDVVTSEELEGSNIEYLVENGHIEPATKKAKEKD